MSLPVRNATECLDGTWRINVGGKIYGPYTGHQVKAFAGEGRLAPHSIVQAGEMGPWITAIDDPILGQLFVKSCAKNGLPNETASGVGASDAVFSSAKSATVPANFLVVADLKGTGTGEIQAAINRLGENYRLTPSVWVVKSAMSAGSLRNELTPVLGRLDSLFVVDASQNRTASFNLGPDADAHIRKLWSREASQVH